MARGQPELGTHLRVDPGRAGPGAVALCIASSNSFSCLPMTTRGASATASWTLHRTRAFIVCTDALWCTRDAATSHCMRTDNCRLGALTCEAGRATLRHTSVRATKHDRLGYTLSEHPQVRTSESPARRAVAGCMSAIIQHSATESLTARSSAKGLPVYQYAARGASCSEQILHSLGAVSTCRAWRGVVVAARTALATWRRVTSRLRYRWPGRRVHHSKASPCAQ